MINGIKGVVTAVWNSLIGYIDCILSVLRYFGNPFGRAFFSFFDGFCDTECTFFKRIFKIYVLRAKMCEAFSCALQPYLVSGTFGIGRVGVKATVIVDNDFGSLAVAFTRKQYIGSGVFQHRNKVGQYEALCIQVFHGLQTAGTLPLPAVEFRFVVKTVALP